ncbi:MAG: aromatic-ring-hydroxylating dioxygenase subunit beta [Deltaproteobacteria bacterium]|nr:aromatic-ring-hydroxylating dioxygenase subunit beta [Deltaproteobacteria bacterium]
MSTDGIDAGLEREVAALINREAMLLDRRRWNEWLDLYAEDAVYWAPAWASEEETTSDPETQLNLLYLKDRGRLEDRVFRIESRQSWASLPLDRTVHVIGNVLVERAEEDEVEATANCIVHVYGKKGAQTRGSRYDFAFKRIDGALKIARKKITFIDDRLEGPVDIYHL